MALRHMGKMPMLRQSDFSNTLSGFTAEESNLIFT